MTRSLRLLCALIALLLALPAMQAPAFSGPAEPMAHHMMAMPGMHHEHAPQPHLPTVHDHDCIGCIAPLDIAVYHPANLPRSLPRPTDSPVEAPYMLTRAHAPEPPPPRSTV